MGLKNEQSDVKWDINRQHYQNYPKNTKKKKRFLGLVLYYEYEFCKFWGGYTFFFFSAAFYCCLKE